jgi:regulatory protein YycI of two-component signal transduction system YycFG
MEKFDFSSIPTIGWISFIILGILCSAVIILAVVLICNVLKNKNIKSKFLEVNEPIREEIKEHYIAEGKDLIDNQSQVAKLMLKVARIRIFEEGLKMFNIKDEKDKTILEMITYRISDRLNYELKNDFTRNHIVNKSNYELEQYANAKSKAYYRLITEKLYLFNEKLPNYELPKIMDNISFDDAKKLFTDIYFSGRDIAGTKKAEGE